MPKIVKIGTPLHKILEKLTPNAAGYFRACNKGAELTNRPIQTVVLVSTDMYDRN